MGESFGMVIIGLMIGMLLVGLLNIVLPFEEGNFVLENGVTCNLMKNSNYLIWTYDLEFKDCNDGAIYHSVGYKELESKKVV